MSEMQRTYADSLEILAGAEWLTSDGRNHLQVVVREDGAGTWGGFLTVPRDLSSARLDGTLIRGPDGDAAAKVKRVEVLPDGVQSRVRFDGLGRPPIGASLASQQWRRQGEAEEILGQHASQRVISGSGNVTLPSPGGGPRRPTPITGLTVTPVGGSEEAEEPEEPDDIVIRPDPVVIHINIPEIEVRMGSDPDPDGVLADTSAAIARGTPRALIPQVKDVRARMKRLSDTHEEVAVRLAAHQAEIALEVVELHLEGDLDHEKARPTLRSLMVLTADLAELGIIVLHPTAAALFKAARLIAQAAYSWRSSD